MDCTLEAASGISVALATCNGEKYLQSQLMSLATQNLCPSEIVACDDHSDDSTATILKQFAGKRTLPFELHENAIRLGYRANFMKAASMCCSELIAFCDQDDIWAPDRLSTVLPYFNDPDVMLVAHKANLIDANGDQIGDFDPTYGLHQQDLFSAGPWPLIYGFAITFRSSLLEYSDLWHQSVSHFSATDRMGHDRWIVFLAGNLGKIVILNDKLVSYRQHKGNLFGVPSQTKAIESDKSSGHRLGDKDQIALIARASRNRTTTLEAISARGAKVSEINQSRFRRFAKAASLREVVHSTAPRLTKSYALFKLMAQRSYARGNAWKFPLHALLSDIQGVMR